MSFRDKVGSFLKREANDLADAAEEMRDKFDDELTKREQELTMTPSEKIKALQQKAALTDSKLDGIADKVEGRSLSGAGVTDVPNVTHILIADDSATDEGAANQPPTVVDASGEVVEIPVVQAPTAADLNKVATSNTPPVNPPLVTRPSPEELAAATHQVVEPTVAKPSNPTPNVSPAATAPRVAPSSHPPAVTPAPGVAKPSNPAVASSSNPAPAVAKPSNPAVASPSNPAPAVANPAVASSSNPAPAAAKPSTATPASSATPSGEENASTAPAPETDYHKAPAQIKYERARAAANDLLDELRGELKDDGEI